jgi:flagellar biosynthesis GTPase FlhF
MAESDPALSDPGPGGVTANVRVAAVENRLAEADRLARAEGRLDAHDAVFKERERAETRAESERTQAAAAIKDALEAASKASADALVAALKNADDLELSRIGRVEDKVEGVKDAAKLAQQTTEKASSEYQESAKDTLKQHNGLLDQMKAQQATYQTKEIAQAQKDGVDEKIAVINKRLDSGDGSKSGVSSLQDKLIAAAMAVAGVLAVLAGTGHLH